jgi:energy-coupling factor transport system ATP-binding protein
MKQAIEIKNLTYTYPDEEEQRDSGEPSHVCPAALTDINLTIEKSTITVIIGPSGCGKTTLCKCLTGIIPKAIGGELTGEVIIKKDNGNTVIVSKANVASAPQSTVPLSKISEDIGLVMQEPDHQIVMTTVEDDIAFAPENLMIEPEEIRKIVDGNIARIGLSGKELASPARISGGEKQRLAIAGILAMGSDIIVFDEPMSSLDAEGRDIFTQIAKQLKGEGKTIIIVEHDYELLDFADTWVLMKEGKIISVTAPDNADQTLLEIDLWL